MDRASARRAGEPGDRPVVDGDPGQCTAPIVDPSAG